MVQCLKYHGTVEEIQKYTLLSTACLPKNLTSILCHVQTFSSQPLILSLHQTMKNSI